MNLGEVFYRQMLRERNAEAIVDGDTRRTYAQWYEDICAVAGGLKHSGIKPGDHFVSILSNRFETATLYWACQMLGAIFTPFNWRANAEEVAYVLADADAVAVAFEARSREAVDFALSRMVDASIAAYNIDDDDFATLL